MCPSFGTIEKVRIFAIPKRENVFRGSAGEAIEDWDVFDRG